MIIFFANYIQITDVYIPLFKEGLFLKILTPWFIMHQILWILLLYTQVYGGDETLVCDYDWDSFSFNVNGIFDGWSEDNVDSI